MEVIGILLMINKGFFDVLNDFILWICIFWLVFGWLEFFEMDMFGVIFCNFCFIDIIGMFFNKFFRNVFVELVNEDLEKLL